MTMAEAAVPREVPQTPDQVHTVTGAFGYSGQHIARRLLAAGQRVRTLTNHPRMPDPFEGRVEVQPLAFDPEQLRASLRGTRVLYNTYWVRFNHKNFTFAKAVANSRMLFDAARDARVQRIVHVSITNPDIHSRLEYFRGKAEVEEALMATGVRHAILRPAVLFGGRDILINNIAWMLRRLPVFGVFGDGLYRVQPIHVEDLAALAVAQGSRQDDAVVEAIGPETFTYRGLVEAIADALGIRRRIISVSPRAGYRLGKVVGWLKGDVTITWQEIEGLMEEKLYVDAPPAGEIRLSAWAREHRGELGKKYHSELARR